MHANMLIIPPQSCQHSLISELHQHSSVEVDTCKLLKHVVTSMIIGMVQIKGKQPLGYTRYPVTQFRIGERGVWNWGVYPIPYLER